MSRCQVQGRGKILSDDAVRKTKFVKGNGCFSWQPIFQSLLKKLQTIDQFPGAFFIEGFDEFRYSAYNKRSVICERPLADVNNMINLKLPPACAPYHLGFSFMDDFQQFAERLSTDPPMRDFFKHLRLIELGEYTTADMSGKQWPDKIEHFCFINNREQVIRVNLNPLLNILGILNAVKRPSINFAASRICDA